MSLIRSSTPTLKKHDDGYWAWYASNNFIPIKGMDIDYLANCIRLIHRRREELLSASPAWSERSAAVEFLLTEDELILRTLFNELNSRDVGEYEDE